tara:strand:+ start:1159 stop:1410 length:252 start_codon:yes stop_codon:yes gene_type:complete
MEKIKNAKEVRTVRKAIVKASEVKDMLKERLGDAGMLPCDPKYSPNMGEMVKTSKPIEAKDKDRGKDQSIEMLGGENIKLTEG